MTKRTSTAWRASDKGHASYKIARAEAQQKANAYGYDYGLEANGPEVTREEIEKVYNR